MQTAHHIKLLHTVNIMRLTVVRRNTSGKRRSREFWL